MLTISTARLAEYPIAISGDFLAISVVSARAVPLEARADSQTNRIRASREATWTDPSSRREEVPPGLSESLTYAQAPVIPSPKENAQEGS